MRSIIAVLLCLLSGAVSAASFTLVDDSCQGWTVSGNIATCIPNGGGGGGGNPPPTPPPAPPPVGSCPAGTITSTIAFPTPGGEVSFAESGGFGQGNTWVIAFTTPAQSYAASLDLYEFQGPATQRSVVISATPCATVSEFGQVGQEASTEPVFAFRIGGPVPYYVVQLAPATTYYVTVRNLGCRNNCPMRAEFDPL